MRSQQPAPKRNSPKVAPIAKPTTKPKATTSATGGRNAQLERILGVLRDLDRLDGVDLYELAERHGATVRTMRRDLEALQAAGLPIEEEPGDGKKKRWRVTFGDKLRQVSGLLDASHYLALKVAMGHGGAGMRTASTFSALEDLSDKIEQAVGAAGRAKLTQIEECFFSLERFAYAKAAPDVYASLMTAIVDRRLCRVTYRAPHHRAPRKTFELLPLKMFVHDGAPYVMAHVARRGLVLTLNLQRLLALKVLPKHAKPPADFDPARLEHAAFGVYGGPLATFVLRFTPDVAGYIRERIWHPTQQLTELRGGGVQLTFSCGESHEVTKWVASWRQWVEVPSPPSLRRELGTLGTWMVKTYGARAQRGGGMRW